MKKSDFTRKKSKKRLIKNNKLGMTYVELLTALALLALIITSFTPMLLSSYETLYEAGEKVQGVYDSKEEIEEGLARRDSEKSATVQLNMKVNADAVFNNINVTGRKIISTFQDGLETVFGQIRARIEIISPSTVYDDKTNHDVILQTFGMEYSKITFGTFTYDTTNLPGAANKMPADQIHIQVMAPNKSAKKTEGTADENMIGSEDDFVYNSGRFCELEYYDTKFTSKPIGAGGVNVSNDTNSGRIKLKIKSPASGDPIDFTFSPLKIKVYYINSRGHLRTVSEYLYIEPATLLMAGQTTQLIDYYTSAGVEAVDISPTDDPKDKKVEYRIAAEARKMRIANSAYLSYAGQRNVPAIGAPGKYVEGQPSTEIRSIRWIDNDETQGLNPYYVMTGTNGSIYRMYTFNSDKSDMFDYAMGTVIKDTSTGFFSSKHDYIDKVYTTTTGRRVYPALWGGDFAHIFEYTSAVKRVAYGASANYDNDQAWATSAKSGKLERAGLKGDPAYNVMSANAQFCYYYNGAGTAHKFGYKDAKPISYILTERGWPIRLYGVIGPANPDKDFFEDFVALWDRNQTTANIRTDTAYGNSAETLAFHYKNQNEEQQSDYVYGGIRIKTLASYPINKNMRDTREDYFDTADDNKYTTSMTKLKNVQKQSEDLLYGYDNDVNVTDVIYIPGAGATPGSTFYVGNVHAYANIIQTDKLEAGAALHNQKKTDGGLFNKKDPIEENGMVGRWYRNASTALNGNACSYPIGAITDYLVLSNPDGTATYICKHNDNDYSRRLEWEGDYSGNPANPGNPIGRGYQFCFANDFIVANDANISYANTQGLRSGQSAHERAAFFLPNQANAWDYLYLGDVSFTFGFASNRERVYTNITYDGKVEYTRSFERLYWRSHYGQDATYYKEHDELSFTEFRANQEAYSGPDLQIHQQNRAVSNGSGGLVKTDAYLNKVNNDYYNVWFPGEMYNLNKIASKDGVTVAVGYAVAGSTFQHARPNDTSVTSTALGSIYNDGVLAAMIEGKDEAFVNLLYYKDNETFDNYSLYDPTSTVGTDYAQYSEYGDKKYGTHSRDSVQFTAVDLIVENVKATETARDYTVNYYAYYGDSKGRVFRSLVASASGTSSGTEGGMDANEAGASLVPYISDTPTQLEPMGLDEPSKMVEIILNDGKTLDQYFSRIVTIDAMDDLVIITGQMRNGGQEYLVVGTKDANTGNWSYRLVSNCGFTSLINDATIVGGYYYIVGDGWLAGVSIDVLRDTNVSALTTPSLTSAAIGSHSENPNHLLWCNTSVNLYAIAGRDTN